MVEAAQSGGCWRRRGRRTGRGSGGGDEIGAAGADGA